MRGLVRPPGATAFVTALLSLALACSPCPDSCDRSGATRCSGSREQVCALGANTCLAWSEARSCAEGLFCDPARSACVKCPDACKAGDTRCAGSQLQTCALAANGCGSFGAPVDCAAGQSCGGAPARCAWPVPDLRFKWVGSGRTLRAAVTYGLSCGPHDACFTLGLQDAILTPPSILQRAESSRDYFAEVLTDPVLPRVGAYFAGGRLVDLPSDLARGTLHGLGGPDWVVAGLESVFWTPAAGDTYFVTSSGLLDTPGAYRGQIATIAPGDLDVWAAERGAAGEVVTALCPTRSGIYVASHARTGDTTTFETSVVRGTMDDVATRAQELSAAGYFITAFGRDGITPANVALVGTRPRGASAPPRATRAIQAADTADPTLLFADGYAVVGQIWSEPALPSHPFATIVGQR
jgi:hypothetical protein